MSLNIVFVGLSITSSWGNGHATTYRGLIRELNRAGHRIVFLEKNVPWYEQNRDQPTASYCQIRLYDSLAELKEKYETLVRDADMVVLGSFVQQGVETGRWILETAQGITAFYDIDTPVTLARLRAKNQEYLHPDLIPRFDLYLSFSGGPVLQELEQVWKARRARPLFCSVDPELYYPQPIDFYWDLGYLGTYSADRQPGLERLLLWPAKRWETGRFVVAGPQYPDTLVWPGNIDRITHLPPATHARFYNRQRFTLNLTRKDMIACGYSPSVRLFEAAACGVPIISDHWSGLETFFRPGREILIARSGEQTLQYLTAIPEDERKVLGENARQVVLARHTAAHRAEEFLEYYQDALVEVR